KNLAGEIEDVCGREQRRSYICMLLSLFFLGTWPAVLAYLERRGRLPQHTYLDYAITNLLAATFIALTLGEVGESKPGMPNFLIQLFQVTNFQILCSRQLAFCVIRNGRRNCLSLGNLSIQYAMALVGLSVVEVVSASITVVIGTTVNYFLDNRINKAEILFPGVGCFLIAVFLGSTVHKFNDADNTAKLKDMESKLEEEERKKDTSASDGTLAQTGTGVWDCKVPHSARGKRSIKVFGRSIWIGLAITFFAGICYSLFSPLFNVATNDQFHRLRKGVPHLVVYTAFFYFSISSFMIAIILNINFLYRPVLDLPKSSFHAYLKDWDGRGWALLAGMLCGFGNGLQFMGGQAAGYAAADAVQALPLVSTFWGVVAFGEYRKSSRKTYVVLVSMLFMFVIAVAILMHHQGTETPKSHNLTKKKKKMFNAVC
ncbi:Ureide permease 2, partial [Bienertia sinuspersici]